MDRIKFAQLTQRITNLGVEAQTLSFTKKDNTLGRKMDQSKNNRSREINNTKLFFLLIHNWMITRKKKLSYIGRDSVVTNKMKRHNFKWKVTTFEKMWKVTSLKGKLQFKWQFKIQKWWPAPSLHKHDIIDFHDNIDFLLKWRIEPISRF